MKDILEQAVSQSGYVGKDPLRNIAQAIFQGEFDNAGELGRLPTDSRQLIPPRKFKKGGSVSLKEQVKKEVGGYGIKEYFPKEVPIKTLQKATEMKKVCKRSTGGMVGGPSPEEMLAPRKTMYERDMVGMKPSKRMDDHVSEKYTKHFNKGGKADNEMPKAKKAPNAAPRARTPYAMGGVGKMRHEEVLHKKIVNKSK